MPDDKDVLAHFLELNDQHRTTIELTMLEGLLLTKLVEVSVLLLAGKSPLLSMEWVGRLGSVNPHIMLGLASKLDNLHFATRQQFDHMMPDIVEQAIKDLLDDKAKD